MATTIEFSNNDWIAIQNYQFNDNPLDGAKVGTIRSLMGYVPFMQRKNDPDKVIISGMSDYNILTFDRTKLLADDFNAVVKGYPLFAYCAESKLSENCPSVLPGYQVDDGEGNLTTLTLQEWIDNQNYTTQDLTNGSKGFGLNPDFVSFSEARSLGGVSGFTVVDTPTYKALLPQGE